MNSVRPSSNHWDMASGATAAAPIVPAACTYRFPDVPGPATRVRARLVVGGRRDEGDLRARPHRVRQDEFAATDVPGLAVRTLALTEAKHPAPLAAPRPA